MPEESVLELNNASVRLLRDLAASRRNVTSRWPNLLYDLANRRASSIKEAIRGRTVR